ncbi:putative nucleotidyltransferase [Neorhizobium galegae]|nr:putative nucleotidyltransferase [Neorhizobium galegae]
MPGSDYVNGMRKQDAIRLLRERAEAIRALGATSLYLFGSVARDEARDESDLDLFIDYDASRKFSLFDLVGLKLFLEEELRLDVDVTTRNSLHPRLRARIEQTAVQVF